MLAPPLEGRNGDVAMKRERVKEGEIGGEEDRGRGVGEREVESHAAEFSQLESSANRWPILGREQRWVIENLIVIN